MSLLSIFGVSAVSARSRQRFLNANKSFLKRKASSRPSGQRSAKHVCSRRYRAVSRYSARSGWQTASRPRPLNAKLDGEKAGFPTTAMTKGFSGGSATRRASKAPRLSWCIQRCSTKSVAQRTLAMTKGFSPCRATMTEPSAGRRSCGRSFSAFSSGSRARAFFSRLFSSSVASPTSPAITACTIAYGASDAHVFSLRCRSFARRACRKVLRAYSSIGIP